MQKVNVAKGLKSLYDGSKQTICVICVLPTLYPFGLISPFQGGRTWQPIVGGKNGHENFRQARIYNFRDKCDIFERIYNFRDKCTM